MLSLLYSLKILSAEQSFLSIIPTVLVPLTALMVFLSSIAAIIASWFGIKLKTEGPRQLLEVLLTKKVILSAIALNALFYGVYFSYEYIKNYPRFLFTINKNHQAIPSSLNYSDAPDRAHMFELPTLNPISGVEYTFKNEYALKNGSFRSPVITNNSIIRSTSIGTIEEIDRTNFHKIREFYIGTFVATRPVVGHNHLYSGEGSHDTHHARIYSFNLASGKLTNTYQTKGHTEGTPIFYQFQNNNYLIAVAGKDGIHVLQAPTLNLIWKSNDGHVDASVAVHEGFIYAGSGIEKSKANSDKRYATKYDLNSGKKIWKMELPLSNWMQPIVTKTNLVCFVLGEIYFKSELGLLHCLDKNSGLAKISITTNSPLVGKPTYVTSLEGDEFIYTSNLKGEVLAFNLKSKEVEFTFTPKKTSNYSLTSPTLDPKSQTLLYQGPMGDLYILHAKTGKLLKSFPYTSEAYASPSTQGNDIYTVDMGGTIRHFQSQLK